LWSRSGLRYVLTKDGRLWTGTTQDSTKRLLAGPPPDAKPPVDTTKAARDAQANERFAPLRVSDDGKELIASNPQGLWFFDLQDGHREMFLASPDSAAAPRYTVDGWSEDRQTVYLRVNSRSEWRRGLARYQRGQRRLVSVASDARAYGQLHFSRNGATAVLTISDRADLWGPSIAPLFVATDSLTTVRSLVDPNPNWPARAFGNAELLPYFDADGRREYGVVYYPPDYAPGKPYPTVFWLYEQFFDPAYLAPIQVLVSSGYVVVTPSVHLDIGYPGEAWLKGVSGAANALIERGIADSARLGVYGISYGGYATNLLVTQTNRFKAAINISGKIDMVSFYTDSPRLGVRNTHAPEKSQDRLGATLWQQPQKYLQHSAILNADRITTPLLLITGEKDANVPARNTAGMFYALRRLGKQVEWVDYLNGGHAWPLSTADDFIDFHRRIVEWFDRYLKR
jgi:dipeptidyl aminopeptidase/acylaminoacyl peptidase